MQVGRGFQGYSRDDRYRCAAAVYEDLHEPRLKVKDENTRRTDLKNLQRYFRYRCEGSAGVFEWAYSPPREEGWLRGQ